MTTPVDPADYPLDGLKRLDDAIRNEAPVDPLPDMADDFYERGARGLYEHRVRVAHPSLRSERADRWEDLSGYKQRLYVAEFRAAFDAALTPERAW